MSKKLNWRQVDALKGCLRYKKQHLLITNFNFHKQIWEFLGEITPFALHWFAFYIWRVMFCYLPTHGRERGREGGRRDGDTEAERERESHLMSPGETLNTISASDQTTNKTRKKIILNNQLIKSVPLFWPRGRLADRNDFSGRKWKLWGACNVWDVTLWHCEGDSEVT